MENVTQGYQDPILQKVLSAYDFPETLLGAVRYGQGHINDTYCVVCQPQEGDPIRFILQGMSLAAFPHPEELMENFIGITSYLRKKIIAAGGNPARETLSLVKTKDGRDFYTDENGKVWRLTPFIENTDCFQSATPELFEASARAFGRFQYLLQDYPAETLHETIVNFHNTEDRFAKFEAALAADKMNRAKDVEQEIQFVLHRKADCSVALAALREGKLPLRVTHNDTKLNNVLLDSHTGRGVCVIDLDTVMPGLTAYDFGDSIRAGASTAEEDERDLSRVQFSLPMFEAFTRGFLKEAGQTLTPREIELLPMGAKLMTLECGMRFLADHLNGDKYFRVHREGHNLDRARTQFALVRHMEENWPSMAEIVRRCTKS